MDFSVLVVDVDGSLANPIMRAAVLIWAVVLAIPSFFVVAKSWAPRIRIGGSLLIFAFGCLSSPDANRALGMLLYHFMSRPGVVVGIIGGPPFFVSPTLGVGLGWLLGLWLRRRIQRAQRLQ